jgi:hypothetical protein
MACFTPEQYRLITQGLLDAFPDRVSLANMLVAVAETPRVKQFPNAPIARKLVNINRMTAEQADMEKVVYDVLREIQANNLCLELVKTAHEWNPFEAALEMLHRQFMAIKTVEPGQAEELEALLTITREQFLNPLTFAARFGPIRYRVCRIEKGRKQAVYRQPLATGFLVNADLVLTNHHVIAPILAGKLAPQEFLCGFDRVELDNQVLSGPTYGLHTPSQQDGWLLAMSDTVDLDYALLRLDAPAGDLPIVGSATDPTAAKRGWLSLSESGSQALERAAPLLIFQHPDGLPLRLDLRMVGMLSAKRVTYTTNTMKGSSGSPCFDRELRLSALHRGQGGSLNEGVPVAAILADLAKKGVLDKVAVE